MAKTKPQKQKLPPIPKGSTVHKRPLNKPTRPVPVSPFRTQWQRRHFYVTPKTPIVSILTRVRNRLNETMWTRSARTPNSFTARLAGKKNLSLSDRVQAIQRQVNDEDDDGGIGFDDADEVVVMGTGRAIEKVVQVAHFFQKKKDCLVRMRTGSVKTVDRVVEEGAEDVGTGDERKRMVSSLEVCVRLK